MTKVAYDHDIVVAIRLRGRSRQQRLAAAEAAFGYALRSGIDEIYMQPAFVETPPADVAANIRRIVKTSQRQGRWYVLGRPSRDDINLALSASPFLESVNLVSKRRAVVTVADAADTLSLEIPKADWDALRGDFENALGGRLDYDIEELAGNN